MTETNFTDIAGPLQSISLFSGVGGFELGMESRGWEPVCFCEIDQGAQAVLHAYRPRVPLHKDVRLLDELPRDGKILVAGFPCTDVSQAGRKQGVFGPNTGLVRDVFRLLKTRPIDTIILENVRNLISLDGGLGLAFIDEQFQKLGYSWAYRVVDTRFFGRPQRRERVFIVASKTQDPREILLADDCGPQETVSTRDIDIDRHAIGFYWTEGNRGLGTAIDAIPPLRAGGEAISAPAVLFPDGFVGIPDIRDAEACQGLPQDWTSPADVLRIRQGRWKLVGNAVTTDIPKWIASRLATPGRYDASNDPVRKTSAAWPKAAWRLRGGEVHTSSASSNPLGKAMPAIGDFLAHAATPLSARACKGFLKRARASTLHFPKGFLDRIERHQNLMALGDGRQGDLFAA